MRRVWFAGVAGAVLASAVGALAAEDQRLSVTIYNSDLALVEDVRRMPVAQGRARLKFENVSARIRPETASLAGEGLTIVEQNFDYDLLTPAKLLEKAVGRQVRIVRTNPGNGQQVTETATVLSVNSGVVLRIGDRIEVLRDDGVPTRVIFDGIPENLRARPTLSVTVQSSRAGPRETTLSYLTHGLTWSADYVALFDEKAGRLDLQGWVTLQNQSGVAYPSAEVQLVAGDINMSGSPGYRPGYRAPPPPPRPGVRRAGTETGAGPTVGDYYLYPLSERTTIAENQTKQVSFLDVKGAAARKGYEHRARGFATTEQPVSADVTLEFANSQTGGLGAQLPAGVVRVYMRSAAGDPTFIGESRIDHTPQGSDISIKTGEAFDVTVQPTVVIDQRPALLTRRFAMSYRLANARSEPVVVTIRQAGFGRDARILEENLASRRPDAHSAAWEVPVPARGEATLNFTVQFNY